MKARDILNLRTGVFAHRGNSSAWPENTLPAFRSAFDIGCHMVETDLHMTRDGALVLWHDEHTGRNTGTDLIIADSTLEELRTLDAGYSFSGPDGGFPCRGMGLYIMTLDELFEEFPEGVFNIDLKSENPEIARLYAESLARHRAWERTITGSFHGQVLRRFRSLAPACISSMHPGEVRAAVVLNRLPLSLLTPLAAIIIRGNLFQIPESHGSMRVADPRLIRSWTKAGVPVQVWTVNDPDDAMRLFRMGVRGVFTDCPAELLAALRGFDPDA